VKKIISFSLWGENPKYTIGAIKNAELAKSIYPGWICRFYCGKSVPKEIINSLKEFDNTEVIDMDEIGNWTGMFWRFNACEDSDIMISRDTDSRLSKREKSAVDEWLNSDKNFHIMRDHPHHNIEILGGMWGCRNGILNNIKELIDGFLKGDYWQVDQYFLRQKVYPIIKDDCFVHDSYFISESNRKKFPTERINKEFVGDVFDENGIRHPDYHKFIK
jgi:hypothetical protein